MTEKNYNSTEYWCYPDEELDGILSHFWFEVRTQKPPLSAEEKEQAKLNNADVYPERYTISSLRNLRNGLTRCLEEHSRKIDLTTDTKFRECQKCFQDTCKELKKIGKGQVKSYPEIEHAGMTLFLFSETNFCF